MRNKISTLEYINKIAPDWNFCRLYSYAVSENSAFVNGPFGSDLLTSELTDSGVPVVYIGDIAGGRYEKTSKGFVTKEKAQQIKSCKTTFGDLLISKVGDPPCEAAIYDEVQEAVITQDVIRIKTGRYKISVFLAHLLNSDIGKRQIHRIKIAGSRDRVSLSDFKKIILPSPSVKEQEKIGFILSIWDTAIEKTERLITAKVAVKKGLMQRLLLGKVRLGGRKNGEPKEGQWFSTPLDWKRVKIGSISKEISKKNTNGDDLPVLSCTKYYGLVSSLEYFDKQIFSIDTSTYKIVEHGQFAYATNHIEEGSIGYQDLYPKGLISPMYTVFETDPNKINDGYLYKLLKTETFRRIFAINTNASVDRRGSLRWKDFAKLPIPLPSLPEQEEINQVLDTAQREINRLQKKLDLLKTQKRGLMQKLLTGQWRVDGFINERGSNDEQGN